MGGIVDGQDVSAAVTDPAFIFKNANDATVHKIGLQDTDVVSGPILYDNVQRALNTLDTTTGATEATPGTNYSAPASTINNGDNHQTALTKLADKFDSVTGHTHDGTAGNGALIDVSGFAKTDLSNLTPTNINQPLQTKDITIGTGTTNDLNIRTGDANFTPGSNENSSGILNIKTGDVDDDTFQSGNINISTGLNPSGSQGDLNFTGNQVYINGNITIGYGPYGPGAEFNMGTRKVTNVVDPTSPQHAATKAYVDSFTGFIKQFQISSSSGTFTETAGVSTAITNFSLNVTGTASNKFKIYVTSDGSGNDSYIGASVSGGSVVAMAHYIIKRNGTEIGRFMSGGEATALQHYNPSSAIVQIDTTPVVGSNTYTMEMFQTNNSGGATAYMYYSKMVVEEL